MQKWQHTYLIRIEYLGFRYSGWQIQPGQRTMEHMLSKTLDFILPDRIFKILAAGRTDAKVSALNMAVELFLEYPLHDVNVFLSLFNRNLPPDIRAIAIEPISQKFNIIKDVTNKEYVYLFSFGEKSHPFCAPVLATILFDLDIDIMKIAARMFEGLHDFSKYTVKESGNSTTMRTITSCSLEDNNLISASFFPKKTYALHVQGSGFLRYQVRMMMGTLIQLGKGEISLSDIEVSLNGTDEKQLTYIAPGSGLHLKKMEFNNFKD